MKVFNTRTGTKEEIPQKKTLRLFVCGPTVYDYLHIGNARTYLVFDSFVKFLRSQRIKVFYLQNITDIDDKIITRAKEQGKKWQSVAAQFKKVYLGNMKALGISAVDEYAPATKFIPEIITQIQTLIKKGNVYEIKNDGLYFDVTTFPNYGKLSHRTIEAAEDGVTRIDESINKRNRADFCVWKFSAQGEKFWQTPLGNGRPGWHIEDTAITEHYFGPQYDIHGGGIDLKFPHHEAEIAQQESASGKAPFVDIWMHIGPLTVNGKKMSKSLGNFITINDFLSSYPAPALRLLALQTGYRSPMNYSVALGESGAQGWETIVLYFEKLNFVAENGAKKAPFFAEKELKNLEHEFTAKLHDDFNTPEALGLIFSFINKTQPTLYSFSQREAKNIRKSLEKAIKSIGFDIPKTPGIKIGIKKMAKERETYRRSKQFIQSDALRKKIEGLGYIIEDTPLGPFLWQKRTHSNSPRKI